MKLKLYFENIHSLIHKNKKSSLIVLFAAGVFFVGLLASFKDSADKTNQIVSSANTVPYLKGYVVKKDDFVHTLDDVYGKISAAESELGFRIPGVIKELFADNGDTVKKGDMLAKIDDTDIFLVQKDREIKLKAASIELKKAKKTYADNQEKKKTGYITASKLENYAFDVELKQSAFELAEINLRMAALDSEKTILKAPFDAVVLDRKAEIAESVKSGETAFVLLNAQDVYADIEISQNDAVLIKSGQKVTFEALAGIMVEGRIKTVIPALLGRAMVLTARVEFDNSKYKLLPGTFVSSKITLHEAKDVFSVPMEYMFRDRKGFYFWQYRDDCSIGRLYVEPGYVGDKKVIVDKGLSEGITLVTSLAEQLEENMQVNIDL